MPAFNDYDFGKAYRADLLREAENARYAKLASAANNSSMNIKDRFLLSAGNLMISFGWKMRRASSCPYPCPELTRA